MNVSLSGSAVNAITSSHNKAAAAANDVANFAVRSDEVGSSHFNNTDLIKPVLSLNEAEFQNSAGVKLLEAEKTMLGSLLDTKS